MLHTQLMKMFSFILKLEKGFTPTMQKLLLLTRGLMYCRQLMALILVSTGNRFRIYLLIQRCGISTSSKSLYIMEMMELLVREIKQEEKELISLRVTNLLHGFLQILISIFVMREISRRLKDKIIFRCPFRYAALAVFI